MSFGLCGSSGKASCGHPLLGRSEMTATRERDHPSALRVLAQNVPEAQQGFIEFTKTDVLADGEDSNTVSLWLRRSTRRTDRRIKRCADHIGTPSDCHDHYRTLLHLLDEWKHFNLFLFSSFFIAGNIADVIEIVHNSR